MCGWADAYFWPDVGEPAALAGMLLDVQLADGRIIENVPYQGRGVFGGLKDIAHWRLSPNRLSSLEQE
jgi:hypothetical protein